MKRLISLLLMLVFILALVSCDPAMHLLDAEELLANTIKIELVNYENENPKMIHNIEGKKKPTFDFNKVTLIATLDDSKIEDVVKDLGDRGYLYWDRTWNEPIGKTLILYQSNGDILVLYGCIYTNEKGDTYYPGACIMFDKDGNYIEYIGDFGYAGMDEIISEYFAITLE